MNINKHFIWALQEQFATRFDGAGADSGAAYFDLGVDTSGGMTLEELAECKKAD